MTVPKIGQVSYFVVLKILGSHFETMVVHSRVAAAVG
jgi:hypothetical protein